MPCRPSVARCPGARCNVLLTSHVTSALWWCYHITRSEAEQEVHDRSNNGSRRQANSSGDIAARRLPLCTSMARMSRHIQANSNRDGAATASARRTSVAFAARQKQNAFQRSDRSIFTANTLGLQMIEQS